MRQERRLLFSLLGAVGATLPTTGAFGLADTAEEAKACHIEEPKEESPRPIMEANGSVTLRFGDGLPQVVCAPLQVCDIELQRGETIRGANLGDAVRWEASPAVSGPEGAEVPHVVIKPKAREIGATSSLVVTTDRRTYHFSLNLSDTSYMPRVTFSYPDAEESAWALYHAQQVVTKAEAKKKHRKRAKVDGESSPIDFSYDIEGKAPWKPLRVYNDGKHTFIDFPGESFYADIPVLLSVATDGQQELVNYRVKGTQFKVDRVLSQAVLVSGVGSDQARVAISRREKDA
jgi:P-type conjugative transfer protein TrbG